MSKINIYLSGNMTPSPKYYDEWTRNFAKSLQLYTDKYYCSKSEPKVGAKLIVQHDLARLRKCDIVVANLGVTDKKHHLTGMIVELYEAIKQHKVVYAFTGDGMKRSDQANSPWMSEFISYEFDCEDDLFQHLQVSESLMV